jgi:hypothetical protein
MTNDKPEEPLFTAPRENTIKSFGIKKEDCADTIKRTVDALTAFLKDEEGFSADRFEKDLDQHLYGEFLRIKTPKGWVSINLVVWREKEEKKN